MKKKLQLTPQKYKGSSEITKNNICQSNGQPRRSR